MGIYTKKGDRGNTCLYGKSKNVEKFSNRINSIGAIDELNSYLGVCISFSGDHLLTEKIKKIQNDLFVMGSVMGGSSLKFYKTRVKRLEEEVDDLEKKLPKLSNFIFPGGVPSGSMLHYARSLARKAEREIFKLNRKEKVSDGILEYANRLSDYLFVLARWENVKSGVKEELWKGFFK